MHTVVVIKPVQTMTLSSDISSACSGMPNPSKDPQLVFCLQFAELDQLPDPCPLPSTVKKRGLNEKERMLYAPMADVGGLMYDKDAVYINIPDWKVARGALLWSCRTDRTAYRDCWALQVAAVSSYHSKQLGPCMCVSSQERLQAL